MFFRCVIKQEQLDSGLTQSQHDAIFKESIIEALMKQSVLSADFMQSVHSCVMRPLQYILVEDIYPYGFTADTGYSYCDAHGEFIDA